MQAPPPELANELQDSCLNCSSLEQPVAVHGPSDQINAVYRCSRDQTVWFANWQRGYRKIEEPDAPSSLPQCKQCGSAVGQPHLSWCSFAG